MNTDEKHAAGKEYTNIRIRTLPTEALLEEYRRLLQDRKINSLPLIISGSSMSPFLKDKKDVVYLSRLDRMPRRGDVLLYKRDSGEYILHRVYNVKNGTMTMIGDGQFQLEPGINTEQVLAIMTAAERKGRRQYPGCFCWWFFEKIWIRLVWLRRFLFRAYEKIQTMIKLK